MAAIAPASVDALLDLLRKSGILSPARLKEVPGSDALPADPRKAAAALVAQGFLTKFQCSQLLAGRHRGFRVGPYAILDILGRGGMGAVYLAEHLELHRKVAIKVLTPIKGDGAQLAAERFLREGRATGALDHPNIIRVFDVTRHQDTPCLIMEYVDGETLQQYVDREGAMPVAVAAECVAQAAAGLQHAHERGFVHRDIKPGNLIRDRDGVVKILDMGLARSGSEQDKLTEQLDHGAVVGTADFISPEQAINSPNTDGRADIYSLGATFYTLLAGRPPFEGNTTQKLMQHQLRDAPPLAGLRPGLPPGLTEVVARMLAKKPADRYQCGGEVVAALAPWTGGSARVVAALSRTNLGQSATLLARVSHSSTALGAAPPRGEAESGIVDPSEAARGTVELRASETMKDRVAAARAAHEAPAPAPARRRRPGLIALVVVAFLVSAGFAGWLAAGGWNSKQESVDAPAPVPHPNPTPAPTQPPAPVRPPQASPPTGEVKPPPPTSKEVVRVAFDPAAIEPFTERTGLMVDPDDPNNPSKKTAVLIARAGPGTLPPGWSGRCWHKDSEMELAADTHDGRPALALRNVRGPGSAMLFTARFAPPSAVVRLKVEYAAPVREKGFTIKFKPDDPRPAWEVARPPVGPGWRTDERLVDLRGASGGRLEFHNGDPAEPLFIGGVTVAEPDPTATGRERVNLSAAKLPDFNLTKRGRTTTAGADTDPGLQGISLSGWKPDTVSEWTCGPFAGARTLAYTNLTEPVSAQIVCLLEDKGGLGFRFAQGQHLRLRVTYRTTGTGHGAIYFQNIDDHKVIGRTALPNSNNGWNTVETVVTRGTSPLRCQVDASSIGAENVLHVREVTVTEFGLPKN